MRLNHLSRKQILAKLRFFFGTSCKLALEPGERPPKPTRNLARRVGGLLPSPRGVELRIGTHAEAGTAAAVAGR